MAVLEQHWGWCSNRGCKNISFLIHLTRWEVHRRWWKPDFQPTCGCILFVHIVRRRSHQTDNSGELHTYSLVLPSTVGPHTDFTDSFCSWTAGEHWNCYNWLVQWHGAHRPDCRKQHHLYSDLWKKCTYRVHTVAKRFSVWSDSYHWQHSYKDHHLKYSWNCRGKTSLPESQHFSSTVISCV